MTNEEAIKILAHSVGNAERLQATQMAIEVLKTQIPEKPMKYNGYHLCPTCESDVILRLVDSSGEFEFCCRFCTACGQRIDWSNGK